MHTPPGSNKSNTGGCSGTETLEIKRTGSNSTHTSGISNGSNNPNTTGAIRNEELSKMFPTPPSLEQHPNSSPCGASGNNSDTLMVDTMDHQTNICNLLTKPKENYPNLGSPALEPIEVKLIIAVLFSLKL